MRRTCAGSRVCAGLALVSVAWLAPRAAAQVPSLLLALEAQAQDVEMCEVQTIRMTLVQEADDEDGPRDLALELPVSDYYLPHAMQVQCYGALPLSCTPVLVGDTAVWYYGDAFVGPSIATLRTDVQKSCSENGALTATARFDDAAHDDDTTDGIASASASVNPIVRSGQLALEQQVLPSAPDLAQWQIVLANEGTGTAYNVWMDVRLGDGLQYGFAAVDPGVGVTITGGQDHFGGAIDGFSVGIDQVAPAEARTVTVTAEVVGSVRTCTAAASWGCIGIDCRAPVVDVVEVPEPARATNACLAVAGLGLLGWRRRSARAAALGRPADRSAPLASARTMIDALAACQEEPRP